MARMFKVSSSPHIRDDTDIPRIMYSVVAALIPALVGAVYFFGIPALIVTALCVVTCVATEGIIERLAGKPLTITDGSAIVTGVLLAFNLPSEVPWWIAVIGGFFAIAVGKMTFGGLGFNPMNPALLARVFLLISWPVSMTTWPAPRGIDAETVATPLAVLKQNTMILLNREANSIEDVNRALSVINDLSDSHANLFFGNVGGCLGETSVLLLLIGAAFLMYKRYIGWRVPLSYIATVGVLTWIIGGAEGLFTGPWLFHILSGGLILGAFFMATDMVTSPITFTGRIIFGVGCGVITTVIRLWGGYPEGVSFSIILMNLTVPLIDRYTRPKVFGKAAKQG
ncbi:RnfABCDGE type electron transport complex subunit D [Candidatus Latescibacterota bacterium]